MLIQGQMSWAFRMELPLGECHKTSLMISQHWLRYWLGAIRQQAITWINDDPDIYHHMAQVMAWCRQASGHYLSQWWPRSIPLYGTTRPQWVNCHRCENTSTHGGILTHRSKATFTHARSGCGAEAGGFWYSHSATAGMFTHTWSGRGRICHFLRTMMVWSAQFWSGRGKLGVGPISCGAVFAPAPPPLRDRACVNACNDLCWSQFTARPRPRPPAHVWTYL